MNWLSGIEPVSTTLYRASEPSISDISENTIGSISRDDESIATKAGVNSGKKLSIQKLAVRRIEDEPLEDPKILDLRLTLQKVNDIRRSNSATESSTEDYFEAELKRCCRNEAVLQRTIMIHFINQYELDKKFDWNTEGQWSQTDATCLKSRDNDKISLPKPDLAISFKLRSLSISGDKSDPVPRELQSSLSPDSGFRCFPFLFFEAQRTEDLQDAFVANLHSASQALYNMHTWIERANLEEKYSENVRVFSVVFNAQVLGVRVHRIVKHSDGLLYFKFDELRPLNRYTKDQARVLIQSILVDYAAKELYLILKTVFREVIGQRLEEITGSTKTLRNNS